MSNFAFVSFLDIFHLLRPYVYIFPLNKGHKISLDSKDIKDIERWVKSNLYKESNQEVKIIEEDKRELINLWRKKRVPFKGKKGKVRTCLLSFKTEDLISYINKCQYHYPIYHIFLNQCKDNIRYFILWYSICWASNKISWLKELDSWYLQDGTSKKIYEDYVRKFTEIPNLVDMPINVKNHKIFYHLLNRLIKYEIDDFVRELEEINQINGDISEQIFDVFKVYFSNIQYCTEEKNQEIVKNVLKILNSDGIPLMDPELFYQLHSTLPHLKISYFATQMEIYDFNISKGEKDYDFVNAIVKKEDIVGLRFFCNTGDRWFVRKCFARAITSLGIRNKQFLDEYYDFQRKKLIDALEEVEMDCKKRILDSDGAYASIDAQYEFDVYGTIFNNLYKLTKCDLVQSESNLELLKSQLQPLKDSLSNEVDKDILIWIRDTWIGKNPELEELIRQLF